MPTEIKIPKLGLTMAEATLMEWSVGAGERVVIDQTVCVIETDKISLEVRSPAAGLLHPIVEAGRRAAVGEVVGYVAEDEKDLAALQARLPAVVTMAGKAAPGPLTETPSPGRGGTSNAPPPPGKPIRRDGGGRIPATPAARKRSRELQVDLTAVAGSGPGGRIILKDVEGASEALPMEKSKAMYDFDSGTPATELLSPAERIPIRGIRKIIARNMKLSLSSQAQLTLHTETSAVALIETRALLNARLEEGRPRISYNAILVKAAAAALRLYPALNSVVDGHTIKIWEQVHVGVAMDFGKGLLVPKIRNPDIKTVGAISEDLDDLAGRAEKNRLLPDELQGGTFTLTNLGGWDIDHFTPINNYPESAILGVGRIVEKPWVRGGAVVVEPRIALSLTFDHRIIDGALAARFLKTIKDYIQEPRLML